MAVAKNVKYKGSRTTGHDVVSYAAHFIKICFAVLTVTFYI